MSGLEQHIGNLEAWICAVSSAETVKIISTKALSGGAIQENWLLDCFIEGGPKSGDHALVLRCDASSSVAASLSRAEEFRVLKVAHEAGVTVPEPLWLCEDNDIMGRAFYFMQRVNGTALGTKVVKDLSLGGDREALGQRLGEELASIHAIRPIDGDLGFLVQPEDHPAIEAIMTLRGFIDALGEARPVLEWGLRWAELNLPQTSETTLVHKDFRTGNYLVDEHGLTAILDWEFAGWGDPMSDIGWFCAECWRFSRPDLEAGGITDRQTFYDSYEAASGRSIDHGAVTFWELMAHIRWAVIALQQSHRHLSGTEPSLELALTGRLLPDLEFTILNMTAPQSGRAA